MLNACYLCGCTTSKKRDGTVRDNPELDVLECESCGLVFLSSFNHIEKGFYENSGMHQSELDINKWLIQSAADDERRFNQFRRRIENQSVLDFGCGAGGFLTLAKQVARKVCGIEVESRLKPYFMENALDVRCELDEFDEKFDVVTLFHVLEHFPNPSELLKKLANILKPGGQILIEVPNANDALITLYRSEAFTQFTYWSCHLFLFNASTLSRLARDSGFSVDYVSHVQRYSPANHLYWLSKGNPGGHVKWHFLDSEELCREYEKNLAALGCTDTITCSLSLQTEK